jgi:hypothetical protein
MKVIVYVEEPSDQRAMEALLDALLICLRAGGVEIEFIATEGKRRLLRHTPIKAANMLSNDPQSIIIALPRLYSDNPTYYYETPEELESVLCSAFAREAKRKELDPECVQDRFQVFVLKYDLEALVLAAESQLASRLGVTNLEPTWTKPVEDIDHGNPPRQLVEDLFEAHGDRYHDTVDAPSILGAALYRDVAAACPQSFKPFVDFLETFLD